MGRNYSRGLSSLLAGAVLAGSAFFGTGCSEEWIREREEFRRQQVAERQRVEDERIQGIIDDAYQTYSNSLVFAQYSLPIVDITSRKSSLSLDPFVHMANAAKAQTISLPVSESYFDSVSEGQVLSSKFNTIGFILGDGDIESYKNIISRKHRSNFYVCVSENGWQEINAEKYDLLNDINSDAKNSRSNLYTSEDSKNSTVFRRVDCVESVALPFTDSSSIVIESRKSNITLDVLKHIENGMNSMRFPIQVPRFLGDEMRVGDVIDSRFVGASLFLSSSPSSINYRVVEKK